MAGDLEVGRLIGGRWRLDQFLGRGGFGQVYRATDCSRVGLGEAAIKILHPDTPEAQRDNFLTEVKNVAQMRHQNLVGYLDSGEDEPTDGPPLAYLVTELCLHSLDDELRRRGDRRLTGAETEALVRDLGDGLAYLHRRGLLHRDLKPGNVLLTADGWKLADFGLTRKLSDTGHYHLTSGLIGTPHYMAPELFGSRPSGPPADVYALGVTVHEALTGRFVHEAPSDVELYGRIANADPVIDPSLDDRWRRFVRLLVQRDPEARPRAGQLVAVLTQPPGQWSPVAGPGGSLPSPPAASWAPQTRYPQTQYSQSGANTSSAQLPVGVAPAQPAPSGARRRLPLIGGVGVGAALAVVAGLLAWPDADRLPPETRAEGALLVAGDVPDAEDFTDGTPGEATDEQCDGVSKPRVEIPPVATAGRSFEIDSGLHTVSAFVFDDDEEAAEYFELVTQLPERCSRGRIDGQSVIESIRGDPLDVEGADDGISFAIRTRSQEFEFDLVYAAAVVGDMVVAGTGDDAERVESFVAVMADRATRL